MTEQHETGAGLGSGVGSEPEGGHTSKVAGKGRGRRGALAAGALSMVAAGALVLSPAAGAVTAPADNAEAGSDGADGESLGSVEAADPDAEGLVASVEEVSRESSGQYVTVLWSITNETAESGTLQFRSEDKDFERNDFAGVTVRDDASNTRFHPGMNGDSQCLCSSDRPGAIENEVEPGQTLTYWSLYSVPGEVEELSVEIPFFHDIPDVPIS
ncbi:hypothetical protein IDM40_18790 [Nocardiopsis sp. HNM0947]|uniref:DUF4352 domain-containing protein n=1 Tax=Nocardiopsis coralli TaxID=2772213 RepID=A0ABR9PA62_9ACTN|nr:hypothetical protein [Nocardiopsis coralli]MBE3000727.1 hypothetical protein [Nocardiopsis coralli]